MRFYHGSRKPGYFEGWYLKQQSADKTLALIPAFHRDVDGCALSSLQIVTKEGTYHADFCACILCKAGLLFCTHWRLCFLETWLYNQYKRRELSSGGDASLRLLSPNAL